MRKRDPGRNDANVNVALVLSGLLQHIGVAMLSAGASIKRTEIKRVYAAPIITRERVELGAGVSF